MAIDFNRRMTFAGSATEILDEDTTCLALPFRPASETSRRATLSGHSLSTRSFHYSFLRNDFGEHYLKQRLAEDEDKGPVHVTFLLNFLDELRRKAPAGGN